MLKIQAVAGLFVYPECHARAYYLPHLGICAACLFSIFVFLLARNYMQQIAVTDLSVRLYPTPCVKQRCCRVLLHPLLFFLPRVTYRRVVLGHLQPSPSLELSPVATTCLGLAMAPPLLMNYKQTLRPSHLYTGDDWPAARWQGPPFKKDKDAVLLSPHVC